jgi:hypothetical protein
MSEQRYHIIFSTLIEGRQPGRVYHDLADLFKIEHELVQQIFACQGSIVKSDLDRATAEQYVQIILAAGAICVIEPMPTEVIPVDAAMDVLPEEQDDRGRTEPPPDVEKCTESYASDTDHPPQQPDREFRVETETGRDVTGFRTPVLAALVLLAGACVPVLSGSGQVHWPWQFAFELQPPGLLWWVAVPVVVAGMLLLLRAPAFSLIVVFAGAALLLGTVVVLWEAALIMPLRILPLDRAAALAYVLPLLGAAICSAACSSMDELGELLMLRLLAACGSLAVLIPAGAALFISGDIWSRWPLILLLLLLLLYASLVLVCACLPSIPEKLLQQARLLSMLLLFWAPIAVFLAHLPLPEPDTDRALFMAVLKMGLLYYGSLAAISSGLKTEFLYHFEK